jgi:hypothetical protein
VRPTLIRILKAGLPTAAALFALGYVLSEAAAIWVTATAPAGRSVAADPGLGTTGAADSTATDAATAIRKRVPLAMAGWGFAIVAGFELLLWAWRGGKAPAEPSPLAPPPPADVDALLNQIMAKAEADRALQAGVDVTTPPPAGCPITGEPENTPATAGG